MENGVPVEGLGSEPGLDNQFMRNATWSGLSAETIGLVNWPDEIDAVLWQDLFGRSHKGILVLIDEQLNETHGQLRALSFLRALGIRRFTFANGWRGLDLIPVEWCRVARDTPVESLRNKFPLVQLISQSMEDASDGDAAYTLLQAYQKSDSNALLVYVFDTPRFARHRDAQLRPFIDQYEIIHVVNYPLVARSFASRNKLDLNTSILSYNLAIQGLARFCRTPAVQVEDVLNINRHFANSPIWAFYEHLCDMVGPDQDTAHVREILRPWIDQGLTRALDQVVLWLQRFDFEKSNIQIRQRMQERRA